MEGRRVTRKSQRYNPLFILFLCLLAAVIVLLTVTVTLGAKLARANKAVKASETQIHELEQTIAQLESDRQAPQKQPAADLPSAIDPAVLPGSDTPAQQPQQGPGETKLASWLDITGHSEVKVAPTNLLDGYQTYYATDGVNMRGGPGTSYSRITTVDRGTKVQVAAQEGGWSFVKAGSKFGWIKSDYLSKTEPAPVASTPASTTTNTNKNNSSSGNKNNSGQRAETTSGSLRTN